MVKIQIREKVLMGPDPDPPQYRLWATAQGLVPRCGLRRRILSPRVVDLNAGVYKLENTLPPPGGNIS